MDEGWLDAEAAVAFSRSLCIAPDDADGLDGLARALARSGDKTGALAAHSRAIAQRPDSATLRTHHASSLLICGEPEQAQVEAEAALELDPHDQQAWALLGLAWRALGDPREPWLNDTDTLVQTFDLPAPVGFGTIEAMEDQEFLAQRGLWDGDVIVGGGGQGWRFGRDRLRIGRLQCAAEETDYEGRAEDITG